jgi:GTP:adenosylcobinamide-phosphate guanylyltransferase
MIAALMCGGKGARMHDTMGIEKPLQRIKNNCMIEMVLHALLSSQMFEKIIAITSVNSPKTSSFIQHLCSSCPTRIELMETAGHGFSQDLSVIVSSFKSTRLFVVPADLPLLNAKTVQGIIARCPINKSCVSILLDKAFVEKLGITASVVISSAKARDYCHSGISIIDCSKLKFGCNLTEYYIIINETEIAFNVNTKRELELAESILKNSL